MDKNFKQISGKEIYNLNIQTKLSDDWIIQSLNSKPYFQSLKLNSTMKISKKDILTIIGSLKDTTNGSNILIINGEYGFINDIFYEKEEYEKHESFIIERTKLLNIKKKDLVIGNLYERPNGSRFIYLGIKYFIKIIKKVNKKALILEKTLSNLKNKNFILDIEQDGSTNLVELDSKNFFIYKDLGNNGIIDNNEIYDYLNNEVKEMSDVFRVYDDKKVSSINISFKEEPYNSQRVEYLKKTKDLIISADGGFYKYLGNRVHNTQEIVSGRPSSNVYYKYDLYQKISIDNNIITYWPKLKHNFLGTNSWYGSSSYTFEDSFSLKNKTYCEKSDTFKKIDNSKIFTIGTEEI